MYSLTIITQIVLFQEYDKSVDSSSTDVEVPPNIGGGIANVWVLVQRKESSTLNMDALC
jgi:hypothetical protein